MAHEVTHVVQQQGSQVVQTSGSGTAADRFEREAEHTATAVQRGDQAAVRERTSGPQVQGLWPADEAAQWVENQAWDLMNQYAPELVPLLRQGPAEWLKEQIAAAVETIFTTLMGPVRAVTGVAGALMAHFATLLSWLRDAAARIARGDCAPLTEAAEKIQQVFEGLTAPVIERIKQLTDRVKGFFSGLWERFGAPVWQFLQRLGGAAWERIQQLGRSIWDKTAPIRLVLNQAWTWIKNKLGIGEGPEGQDGILQWLQRQAQAVWDQYLKPFYERFRTPILVTVGILALLSPAGPLIAIAATGGTLAVGLRWISQNLRNRTAIVQQRGFLENTIIPGIMNAVTRVSAFVLEKAQFISGKLTAIVTGLNQAVGAVAGTLLNFVVGILQWIIGRYQELVRWATEQLLALAEWVRSALERLRIFLAPVLNFLRRVAAVVANVARLPYELGAQIWNAIPVCLREPYINFFVPLILRQIPFFRDLVATPEVWQQTRAQVMELIQLIFRDFNLVGAMRAAFRLVVRTLRIPVELIGQLLDKAASTWEAVIAAPLRFIENALKAILRGMGNFMRNILSHLWFGVQGWLFNSLQGTGVTLPSSWTDLGAVFGFVLDVLGISVDHVIALIDRREPGAGRLLQGAKNVLTGTWEWLRVALTEGPRGLWRMVVDRLTGLGQIVLESAVRWVMTRIVAIVGARLTALAASAGWSLVIEAVVVIYQAIRTAMEYAQRILQILLTAFNTVAQIAQGVIGPAATMIENGLRMILPIVIGFLANYAGLGGISNRIRDIIEGVRERVDAAILWLIDRGMAALQGVLNAIRSGVATIVQWWRNRKRFRAADGQMHSLYFRGEGRNARLWLESDPTPFETFIQSVKPTDTQKQQAKTRALELARQMDDLRNRASPTDGTLSDTDAQRLEALWDLLVLEVAALFASGTAASPQYGPRTATASWGSGMLIQKLAGAGRGSEPSVSNGMFENLNLRPARQHRLTEHSQLLYPWPPP